MEHDLLDLDAFHAGHQRMRQFVSKDRKEETERGDDSQDPGE